MKSCPKDANWFDGSDRRRPICGSYFGAVGCTRKKGHKGLHHRHDLNYSGGRKVSLRTGRKCFGSWSDKDAKIEDDFFKLKQEFEILFKEFEDLIAKIPTFRGKNSKGDEK